MKPIRFGLLGCGGIQRKHLSRLLSREDAEVVALADVEQKQIDWILEAERATDLNAAQYTDEAAFFGHEPMEAVVISTPHSFHASQILAALDHDLEVLVEKPMVIAVEDAEKIIERTAASKRQVQVAYNSPFAPEIQYVRDCIRNETYGRLQMVSGYISQSWKAFVKGTWREVPAISGGGFAYDSGAHPLNTLCWTIDAMPDEVFAVMDDRGAPVEINAAIYARFESDVMMQLTLAGDTDSGYGSFMVFAFDRGRIEVDPWGGHWIRLYDQKGQVKYPPIPNAPDQPVDHFIDSISGKVEPLTSPRNGLIHSQLMELIYASAEAGRVVKRSE